MPVHNPSTWTVVIPSFNHADDTITCLESLWNASPRPGKVLVVDDASTDAAVTQITRWAETTQIEHRVVPTGDLDRSLEPLPWLTVVAADKNAGFIRSCNMGLRYVRDFTSAPFALLLNNDAAVTPSYFSELAKALEVAPEAGLLTGSIYEWDRSTLWYGGGSFNPVRALGTHMMTLPQSDVPIETGYVCGCSMLISRRVLDRVGFLAECFRPIYVEDVDYSLRVRAAGFPVMIARAAVCYHRVGTTLGKKRQSAPTVFAVNRNRAFTVRRNYSGWRRVAGITYLAVTKPGRAVLELVQGRPHHAWAYLSGMVVGVFSRAASGD
jgi:GT2 family glycosyltransferase